LVKQALKPCAETPQTGSAADPASLGTAALLLSKTDKAYTAAALRQKDVLLNSTPRFTNDAISHRESVAELWSDFMFMVPPFLSHYALITRDAALLQEVVRQCELQREVLQDRESGLWKHVVGPQKPDPGFWSTGNGWAVCGLVRVYAAVRKFRTMLPETVPEYLESQLEEFIKSIIRGAVSSDAGDGLLRNYLNDASYCGEKAGTAAIASAIFRMAVLKRSAVSDEEVAWAETMVGAVLSNLAKDGTIAPVVNPLTSRDRVPQFGSAEGQAFTLYLIAAQRDWHKHEGD
jgi:rhamnogalacturonyl hydrolase YesR